MAIVYAVTDTPAKVGDIIFGDVPNMHACELECGTQIYSPEFCLVASEDDDLNDVVALSQLEINEEEFELLTNYVNITLNRQTALPIKAETSNIAFCTDKEWNQVNDIMTLAQVAYTSLQFKHFTVAFVEAMHRIKSMYDTVEWTKRLTVGDEENTAEMLWGYLVNLFTTQKILAVETKGFTGYTETQHGQKFYARVAIFTFEDVQVAFCLEWKDMAGDITPTKRVITIDNDKDFELIPGGEWDEPSVRSEDRFRGMLDDFARFDVITENLRFDLVDLRKDEYSRLLPFTNMLTNIPEQ